MTFAPPDLQTLNAYWQSQGGVGLGIVGNTAHTKGYHLGRDRIYDGSGPGQGDADYSVTAARDKAGLTNASSGIDLGKLDGTLDNLRKFSDWIVGQCRAGAADALDIREVIWTPAKYPAPDGEVLRWDKYRGQASQPSPDIGGDDSHLTHTHISYIRDTRATDKTRLFRRYFEENVMGLSLTLPDASPVAVGTVAIPVGTVAIRVSDGASYKVTTAATRPAYAMQLAAPLAGKGYLVDLQGNVAHFVRAEAVTFTPAPVPAPPAADCTAAVAAAHTKGVDEGAAANESKWEAWIATHP